MANRTKLLVQRKTENLFLKFRNRKILMNFSNDKVVCLINYMVSDEWNTRLSIFQKENNLIFTLYWFIVIFCVYSLYYVINQYFYMNNLRWQSRKSQVAKFCNSRHSVAPRWRYLFYFFGSFLDRENTDSYKVRFV